MKDEPVKRGLKWKDTPAGKKARRINKRRWYQNNKDKARDYNRRWSAANPERRRELNKEHYYRHRAKRLEKARRYRLANLEKVKAGLRAYYAKNREALLINAREQRYGMSPGSLVALHEQQGQRCAICTTKLSLLGRNSHVDHCHATGVVRGLLCNNCNPMLGHARDDIDRLKRAIAYLKKHKK